MMFMGVAFHWHVASKPICKSPATKSHANREGMKMSRFLASVNIFTETSQIDEVLAALSKLENIEEVYEVAGEYDIVTLVSTSTLEEFRDILQKRIMKIKGVKSTISTIILQPHKGHRCKEKTSITSAT
jgi:DNA-binding Lrp family transcriptional regulator